MHFMYPTKLVGADPSGSRPAANYVFFLESSNDISPRNELAREMQAVARPWHSSGLGSTL